MNALININKYTEDNQPSKKLEPASQQRSQFMSSAPTLSWIFITAEYDLTVQLLIDLTRIYSRVYIL